MFASAIKTQVNRGLHCHSTETAIALLAVQSCGPALLFGDPTHPIACSAGPNIPHACVVPQNFDKNPANSGSFANGKVPTLPQVKVLYLEKHPLGPVSLQDEIPDVLLS